jgi:hypothetical protein
MGTTLQALLTRLLNSGDTESAALNFLVDDYAKYHFVMVFLGGASLLLLLIFSLHQFRALLIGGNLTQNFRSLPGKVHLYLATFSGFVGLLMALVVAGNLGNALQPITGFKNSLTMLGDPISGSKSARIQMSFTEWLTTGDRQPPAYITQTIDERLAWQRPKAIICFLLLGLAIYFSWRIWVSLINGSISSSRLVKRGRFALGVLLSLIVLLLLIMFIANTQGSFAPAALTLFFS